MNCRSCGAPIFWATTEARGKAIPIDAAPVADGNVTIVSRRHGLVARVAVQDELVLDDELRYTSHFATCPDAEQHRTPSVTTTSKRLPRPSTLETP